MAFVQTVRKEKLSFSEKAVINKPRIANYHVATKGISQTEMDDLRCCLSLDTAGPDSVMDFQLWEPINSGLLFLKLV